MTGAAANFFLLKCKPPIISSNQMYEFIKTFFGNQNVLIDNFESHLSDLELNKCYVQGYRQISDNIKRKIRANFYKLSVNHI